MQVIQLCEFLAPDRLHSLLLLKKTLVIGYQNDANQLIKNAF